MVDLLRKARPRAYLRPVLITAGHTVSKDGPAFNVPKVELVSTVATLLHSRRLEIPREIPESQVLEKELLAFRAKVTAKGNETFEADWRSRQHDDLVLSLAIAAFLGENAARRRKIQIYGLD